MAFERYTALTALLFKLATVCTIAVIAEIAHAEGPWNGKSAAVVLTYDDGLNVHLDTVAPLLDRHNFKATFYVTGNALVKRPDDWRKTADAGHELGNHTMVHPCSGSLPGREWVPEKLDLDNYSYNDFIDEISTASALLNSIDNKSRRSFAYTCGDNKVGGISIESSLKRDFSAARGVSRGINRRENLQLHNLLAYSVAGQTSAQLEDEVKKALSNNGLLVFLFHGVGGDHGLNIDREQHRRFIEYLNENRKNLWVAPLVEVAEFLQKNP